MIEIKNRCTGEVIYTVGSDTLRKVKLRRVNLRYANLTNADLNNADLIGAA